MLPQSRFLGVQCKIAAKTIGKTVPANVYVPRGAGQKEQVPLSSGRWESPARIAQFRYQKADILIGSSPHAGLIGSRDDRHIITVAGSRAGKGASVIIPNLCLYPGSCLVIDPKGENAMISANRRGHGSDYCHGLGFSVHVIDPFDIVPNKEAPARFNPMDDLDPDSLDGVDDAALLAEALIISENGKESHWSFAARNLLRGLILYVARTAPPGQNNLCTVRDLLTLPMEEKPKEPDTRSGMKTIQSFTELLTIMSKGGDRYGVIARSANSLSGKTGAELSGVLSTAQEQTAFLDSGPMRDVLSRSDFKMADLKTVPGFTVYLCLPAMRIETHYRWLRLLVTMALTAMERTKGKPPCPVWFVLDEFAALGYMASLEKAAGLVAGYGVRLHPIIQDLTQLKSLYSERWETFLGNAGVLQFFGNTDLFTCEHISNRLGHTEIIVAGVTENVDIQGNITNSQQISRQTVPLLRPDEVSFYFSRDKKSQIVFSSDNLPMALSRVDYFDLEYRKIFQRGYDWHENLGVPKPFWV